LQGSNKDTTVGATVATQFSIWWAQDHNESQFSATAINETRHPSPPTPMHPYNPSWHPYEWKGTSENIPKAFYALHYVDHKGGDDPSRHLQISSYNQPDNWQLDNNDASDCNNSLLQQKTMEPTN